MNIIKIINDVINETYNAESYDNDITRNVLKYQFDDEKELSNEIIINQNKANYEIIQFLKSYGFYSNGDYDTEFYKNNAFKPSYSSIVGTLHVTDFIVEFKKYISKKFGQFSDEKWENVFNNQIKPQIIKILTKYNFELDDVKPLLFGQGDMLIRLKTPTELKYSTKYPQGIINNPNKIMTTKEFMGIEDRKEKRKFLKCIIDKYEYKFLLNPINQDRYFGTGDKGVFGGLFGGALSDFLELNNVEYENVILQINKNFNNYNIVIGGDGFYFLSDVEKFKNSENYDIRKITENNITFSYLEDLKNMYYKLNNKNIKMIVLLTLGGNLTKTKNGGFVDKNSGHIYYSYIII